MPAIGLIASMHDLSSANQLDTRLLQALHLPHCRIDVSVINDKLTLELQNATNFCTNLKTSAELALYCENTQKENFIHLKHALFKSKIPVTRFCIYDENKVTSDSTLKAVVPILKDYAPNSTIATGTDYYFVEINRQHPVLNLADEICYSVNPQVHTFDSIAIMENLPGIAATLISSSKFKKHTETVITPITLRPRKNKKKPQKAGGNDPRQSGLFCAAWTLGTIFYGISGKAKSLTLYNMTGDNGIMQTNSSTVFPAYYVFLWLSGLKGTPVTICDSSHCSKVIAFVVETKDSPMLLMANITDINQSTHIFGLPEKFSFMILNEKSYLQAISSTIPWNSIENYHQVFIQETWQIELLPYSVVIARLV